MKTKIQNRIKEVKTLNDFLNVLQSEFKTAECKPGRFVKATVIHLLIDKLQGQNVIVTQAIKTRVLESESIEHFIKIVQAHFNCDQLLTGSKEKLISDTEKLQALTGLKEKEEAKPKAETTTDEKKKRK